MNEDRGPTTQFEAPAPGRVPAPEYQIRVAGRLGTRWSAWFDGLTITTEEDGTTVIRGPVVDQAALHGLIQKLRDVGIPLVSLTPIPPIPPTAPAATTARANPEGERT